MLMCIAIVGLTSCSESEKEITPTRTDFSSGELGKRVEVVDQPCTLNIIFKDEAIPSQHIKLAVKLKTTKDPIYTNIDPRDISFHILLSIATIDLKDESGTKIIDLSIDEDALKLKKLLQMPKGSEETIIFEGIFHNSGGAQDWFDQTVQFTPNLTADITIN